MEDRGWTRRKRKAFFGEGKGTPVESVGDQPVHLTALTGMEMYEATVTVSDTSAVVVRSTPK